MANAFGSNINSSLEAMLQLGASQANAGTGAAQQGVNAAQSGLLNAQLIGNEIRNLLGNADDLANNAAQITNGATGDIDTMRSLLPGIQAQVGGIDTSAALLSALAQSLQGKAGDIASYAPQVAGISSDLLSRIGLTDSLAGQVQAVAGNLQPHADALTQISQNLNAQGLDMTGRANTVLNQGQGLLNMDKSSSSLAAELMKLYEAVNPDAYAARAGADAQAQSDSAYQQLLRNISRSGGSVTGGNALALQKQMKTALAAAKASAMTRGRQTGYDKQSGYLKDIASIANTLLGTGTTMFNSGTSAEAQAAAARKSAADVETQMGTLLSNAASIFGIGNTAMQGAGSLLASAAGIEGQAANALSQAASAESQGVAAHQAAISGINTQAGILNNAVSQQLNQASALNQTASVWQSSAAAMNSYLSNLNSANAQVVGSYGTLANAFQAAASYYINAANTEVGANLGRGGGGGGVTITPAQEDDWMNWMGTGHSETWNHNHPRESAQLLAAAQGGGAGE